ncbi:hypothetical protein GUY60_20060 [Streptomyces sp. YC537]|uniref:Bacterial toxin 44 domain-containing protein n=2 Tax=Streptomyces boluensis TaxID=1775135 RepID=A0A964UVI6_9ACTN|nr:hypothetical protein [Streptomyces boluensis]
MKNNIHSTEVDDIRELLADAVGIPPNPLALGEALVIWKRMVEGGAEWDHKPKLEERYGLDSEIDRYFKIPGDSAGRAVYYDMWSNIHYGYVGAAAGFSLKLLQFGAVVAPGAGTNDKADELYVDAGYNLWHSDKGGEGLPYTEFEDAVGRLIGALQKAKDEGEDITQLRPWQYSAEALEKGN